MADPGCGEDYAVGDDDRPFGQDAHRPDALPAIDRTASDDGVTVSDRVTGLLWQRCALGQIYDAASDDCVAPVARQTHAGAVAYCEALDLAGRSWRLPSARELATLPDYGFAQPTLDPALFPGAPTDNQRHWAATVDAADTDRERAWTLSLPSGSLSTVLTIPGSSEFGVRCVSGPALPSRSFTDNGDGTVTESTTGLLFTRCALEAGGASPTADASAACERANEDVRWVDALEGCERLDFAGRTDWRLPPVRELALLVDFTRADPALDPAFFPLTTGDDEWTSTYSPLSPAARMAVQTWGNGLIRGNAGVSAARPARCVAGP